MANSLRNPNCRSCVVVIVVINNDDGLFCHHTERHDPHIDWKTWKIRVHFPVREKSENFEHEYPYPTDSPIFIIRPDDEETCGWKLSQYNLETGKELNSTKSNHFCIHFIIMHNLTLIFVMYSTTK